MLPSSPAWSRIAPTPPPPPPPSRRFFETFSFLPPLTNEQITKQVDFIVSNGYTPCLEFAPAAQAYVNSDSCNRFANGASVNYFDNRYWTMWKLPMFGCQDGAQVLKEVSACTSAFPNADIRLVAFDNLRQMQISGFLVHRPAGASEFRSPGERSI